MGNLFKTLEDGTKLVRSGMFLVLVSRLATSKTDKT